MRSELDTACQFNRLWMRGLGEVQGAKVATAELEQLHAWNMGFIPKSTELIDRERS